MWEKGRVLSENSQRDFENVNQQYGNNRQTDQMQVSVCEREREL